MGKPTEQWYAIDHIAEGGENSTCATGASTNRSGVNAGAGSVGGSGASRLWTSARRPPLQTPLTGEEYLNAVSKTTGSLKVSAILHVIFISQLFLYDSLFILL